jgi:hypothetical protein
MALEKQESTWLKQERLLKIKSSEDGIGSSKQLSLAENKRSKFNLVF